MAANVTQILNFKANFHFQLSSGARASLIYDKDYVLLNLVTRKCFCLYMLRQGLYITVYIYTERCVIMQVFVILPQSASESTRILIKYQLCVKTNSCGFNCKPDNKNRNPENL